MMIVKFMGSSDIRMFYPGATLLDQVEPLEEELVWDKATEHLLDTEDHPDVPQEFWDVLLEFDEFKDVTDDVAGGNVPRNEYEKLYKPISA